MGDECHNINGFCPHVSGDIEVINYDRDDGTEYVKVFIFSVWVKIHIGTKYVHAASAPTHAASLST